MNNGSSDNREKDLGFPCMSDAELATYYGIHPRTFRKWLKPIQEKIGQRQGRFWTPKQVSLIIDFLGKSSTNGDSSL